jgi:hypothetical protein
VVEHAKDLLATEDGGKPTLALGLEVGEEVPVALEDVDKEELDAAVADA